jgi:hypothetical protein
MEKEILAVALAKKHVISNIEASTSAIVALRDAEMLLKAGSLEYAKKRAVDSLRYSVGIFHTDYIAAARTCGEFLIKEFEVGDNVICIYGKYEGQNVEILEKHTQFTPVGYTCRTEEGTLIFLYNTEMKGV